MHSETAGATQMRNWRASLTPEQRAAYLARRVEYNRKRREDPDAREAERVTARRSYKKLKADPKRNASLKEDARCRYKENQPWRIAQTANLRAAGNGLKFDLTKEWVEATWTGKCAVTGMLFVLGGGKRNIFSASLDRKDNALGYTQDNCRWVLLGVNLLKYTGTDAEMLEIAKAIVRSAK